MKPHAGDLQNAINAAVGRTVVNGLAIDGNSVTRIEYVTDVTPQEQTAAQTAIANFDWNNRPLTDAQQAMAAIKNFVQNNPDETQWTTAQLRAGLKYLYRIIKD